MLVSYLIFIKYLMNIFLITHMKILMLFHWKLIILPNAWKVI